MVTDPMTRLAYCCGYLTLAPAQRREVARLSNETGFVGTLTHGKGSLGLSAVELHRGERINRAQASSSSWG